MTDWFTADKEGLAQLIADKPKVFLIHELLQNAIDEDVQKVSISIEMQKGRPLAHVIVEDDSPEGFRKLSDAYTLYAPSYKKNDPEKYGRFNEGEKYVLALCKEAEIISTKGGVRFDEKGRHKLRSNRDAGTKFSAYVRMTRAEFDQICQDVHKIVLPPELNVVVTFNDQRLFPRQPVHSFEASLPTLHSDEEGNLRPTSRKTMVNVYEPFEDEEAMIYEGPIPVVSTGDKWHYQVMQKVPLNRDRDNVTPSYLRSVRVLVLNEMHEKINKDEAAETWVRDAGSDERCESETFQDIITKRFGENRVVRDPTDPESVSRAVAAGYSVLEGRSLSEGERHNLKRFGSAPVSSKLFKTHKPYSDDPDADPVNVIDPAKYAPEQKLVVDYIRTVGSILLDKQIQVRIVHTTNNFSAAYGNKTLYLNLFRLGNRWFQNGISEKINSLMIHELAHEYESNHLSENYYRACCDVGARLVQLALNKPKLFP